MVQANLDKLNPETLFLKNANAVSNEYATLTTKLVTQLSAKHHEATASDPLLLTTLEQLEDKLITIFGQLLQVVNYLHQRNIVHRDIRLETVDLFDEASKFIISSSDVRISLRTLQKAVLLSDR